MTNDKREIVNLRQIAPAMLVEKKFIVLFSENVEMKTVFSVTTGVTLRLHVARRRRLTGMAIRLEGEREGVEERSR